MDSTDTEIKSSAKVTLESIPQWNQHIKNKADKPTAYSYSAGHKTNPDPRSTIWLNSPYKENDMTNRINSRKRLRFTARYSLLCVVLDIINHTIPIVIDVGLRNRFVGEPLVESYALSGLHKKYFS